MMRVVVMLLLLAQAALASSNDFYRPSAGFQGWLDERYGAALSGLTMTTQFGTNGGNVFGTYDTLTYTETDPVFVPWLASFSATNVPGATYSADNTTTTNNGSGQFSVKGYNYVYYQVTNNADWIDFEAGNFRQATWGEMESGPAAVDWGELE